MFFNNNKTLKSLTINECEVLDYNHRETTATHMTDLKSLMTHSIVGPDLKDILDFIYVPQFKSLDTVRISLPSYYMQVVATDDSGHTFEFSQSRYDPDFHPLQHLGAHITTLRLDRGMTLQRLVGGGAGEGPWFGEVFQSLDAVRVLEFDGMTVSGSNVISNILSITGVFPGLEVIRLVVWGGCKAALELLAPVLRQRLEEGNPLATIEPLFAEGENGTGRAEWEKHYEAEGIQNLLSG